MSLFGIVRKRKDQPPVPQSREERSQAAFDAAYRAYHAHARHFARRFVRGDADDVVQDAFLALWDFGYRDREPLEDGVEDVLYRILRRRIIDWYRKKEVAIPGEEAHVLDIASRLTNHTDTARVADGSMLATRIAYLMAALPEQWRRAHELRESGHEYDDIATELQVPRSTARWMVAESRKRIGKQLAREGYATPSARPQSGRGEQ